MAPPLFGRNCTYLPTYVVCRYIHTYGMYIHTYIPIQVRSRFRRRRRHPVRWCFLKKDNALYLLPRSTAQIKLRRRRRSPWGTALRVSGSLPAKRAVPGEALQINPEKKTAPNRSRQLLIPRNYLVDRLVFLTVCRRPNHDISLSAPGLTP